MTAADLPSDTLSQCKWHTASNVPCRNFALPDSDYCMKHQIANTESVAQEKKPPSDETVLEQLIHEIKVLKRRLQELLPKEKTHSLYPDNDSSSASENTIIDQIRKSMSEDIFDLDTWRGAWYMLTYTYEYQTEILKRRIQGDYETDEYGLDMEFLSILEPIFEFMYKKYWRIETNGIENVPTEGSALLVANHSGQVPWDSIMLTTTIRLEHPSGRLVRTLYDPAFSKFFMFSNVFNKIGQTASNELDALRLLEADELLAFFPEGYHGISKLFKNRYKLSRFRNLEFIKVALGKKIPIIPISIVGAEESYISIAQSQSLAQLIGAPYFTITPVWPFLGPIGSIPLPSKWYIDFYPPINLGDYSIESTKDLALVNHLAEHVRQIIQQMVNERLMKRDSILFG